MKNKVLNGTRTSLVLIITLVSAYTFISLTKSCFSSAMVFIVEERVLTKFETGVINGAFYTVYAFLQMSVGPLIDRWKPEKFITIGLLGAAVSNFVIYLNQSYAVMLSMWILNAVLQCAVWPSTFKIATNVVRASMRSVSVFFINLAGAIGGILSFLIAAIVSSKWQLNFLISAVGLVFFAALWELVAFCLKPYMTVTEEKLSPRDALDKKQKVGLLTFVFSAGLLLLFFISISRSAFDLGLRALTPSIINESYEQVSAEISSLLNIIVIVAGSLGMMVASYIYPRFVKNEAVAVLALFLLSFPFTCLLLLVGKIHYIFIVAFLAIMVFFLSAASMFTISFVGGRFNRWNMGATVVGFVNGGAALGIVVANILFTAIADKKGWHATIEVWIILMALSILLAVIFFAVWTRFLKKMNSGEYDA